LESGSEFMGDGVCVCNGLRPELVPLAQQQIAAGMPSGFIGVPRRIWGRKLVRSWILEGEVVRAWTLAWSVSGEADVWPNSGSGVAEGVFPPSGRPLRVDRSEGIGRKPGRRTWNLEGSPPIRL